MQHMHACTDKLPVISDHTQAIHTQTFTFTDKCAHVHIAGLALLAGAGRPSGLLAG